MFTEAERQESSTYRELLAVQFVLSSFSSFLPNSRVKRFTDSQGAARIVQVSSMNFNLHKLASDIFSLCFKVGIYLDIQWVPRSLNEKADFLSKIVDYDNWELASGFFRQLDELGDHLRLIALPPTTTRRSQNIFLDSGTLGQPGLTRFSKTGYENCLVVPPVVLLSKVLSCMFRCNVRGTLVAPYWPSAPFWPLLVHKFWDFVVDYSFFEGRLAFRQGRNTKSLLGSASWDGLILAVKV